MKIENSQQRSLCRAGLLMLLAACTLNLRAPKQANITCQFDTQCPTDLRCSTTLGRCVSSVANQAPTLTATSIGRSNGSTTEAQITIFDQESDPTRLAVSLLVDDEIYDLDMATSPFSTSPDGQSYTLSLDLLSVLGTSRYRPGLKLRFTPRDATGIGAQVVSESFEFGNDAPLIESLSVQGAGGVVAVTIVASDTSADDAHVVGFEYSTDDFTSSVAVPLDSAHFGDAASLSDVPTLGALAHVLAWNTALSGALQGQSISVRAKVADAFGAESPWFTAPPVTIDNAPTLALALEAISDRALVDIPFFADVTDPNVPLNETVALSFEYTTDAADAPAAEWHGLTLEVAPSATDLSVLGHLPYLWHALSEAQSSTHLPTRSVATSDQTSPIAILAYTEHLSLRASAIDSAGLHSQPATLSIGAVGNDPPVATIVGVSTDPRNDIALQVTISDSSFDASDLQVQFRQPGDSEFRSAALVLSNVTDLATSPIGVTHLVLWQSNAAPNLDPLTPQGVGQTIASDVELRVRAIDRAGSATSVTEYLGTWSTPIVVAQVRNQTAPRVDNISFDRLVFADGSAPVAIRYRLIDEESDPVDVSFELAFDHEGFEPCPAYPSPFSEPTTRLSSGPAPGVEHVFIWNPTADRIRGVGSVELRISSRDGVHPATSVSQRVLSRGAQSSFAVPNDARYVESPPTIDIGYSQVFIMSGDVTGDGIVDLVSVEDQGPTAQVHRGSGTAGVGNGAFTLTGCQHHCADPGAALPTGDCMVDLGPTCAGPTPTATALFDLTGDGWLDLVLVNTDDTLTLMEGTGSAGAANDSFVLPAQSHSLSPLVAGPTGLLTGYFDAGGIADVAVVTANGTLAVFAGSTAPYTLTLAAAVSVGTSAVGLVKIDLDGDGDEDFITLSDNPNSIVTIINDLSSPSPSLTLGPIIGLSFAPLPLALTTIEVNGDDLSDLAVTAPGILATYQRQVSLPYFTLAQTLSGPVDRPTLSVADLNADGVDDLLATERGLTSTFKAVSVYFGRGAGLAQPQPLRGGLDRALSVTTGFFNEDDLVDVAYVKDDLINGTVEMPVQTLITSHDLIGDVPRFSAPQSLATDTDTFNGEHLLRTGDFNGDGIMDLAYTSRDGPEGIGIKLGTGFAGLGDGNFEGALPNFAGQGTLLFEAEDVNADGLTDLVLLPGAGAQLVVALSDGTGTFTPSSTFSLGGAHSDLLVTDLTGDGITDIVVSSVSVVGLELFVGGGSAGKGDGSFASPVTIDTGTLRTRKMVAGDFNGDGNIDIVCRRPAPSAPILSFILWGLGSGTFDTTPAALPGITLHLSLHAVDLNRDGLLDLVTGGGSVAGGKVIVYLGQAVVGSPFAPGQVYDGLPGSVTPGSVFVVDEDLDGVLDLVAFTLARSEIILFRGLNAAGTPTGAFAPYVVWGDSVGHEPSSLVVRDFNGDDTPDWAIVHNKSSVIGEWFGQQQRHQSYAQAVRSDGRTMVRPFGTDVLEPDSGLFGSSLGTKSVIVRPVFTHAFSSSPDFWNGLVKSSLSLPHPLTPLTQARLIDGFQSLRRVAAPPIAAALGPRLQLFNRFGPLVLGAEPARAGLDLSVDRGLIVSLPLTGLLDHAGLTSALAPPGKVHVYKLTRTLLTSNEIAADPLDDGTYLPRRPAPQPYDSVAYREAWLEVPMDDNQSFTSGTSTGERFVVELGPLGARTLQTSDIAEGQLHILLETPGVVQAFVEP